MAYTPTRLYQGQLSTTETTATPGILTAAVPASTTWIVKEIVVCNTNTNSKNSVTVSLSVVPSGQTGATSNRVLSNVSVSGNQTLIFGLSTVMTAGDFITALASGSGVTVTVSGVTIS